MRYVVMVLVAAAMACSQPGSHASTCTPGASQACACSDGRNGAQVCGADGTFGACSCSGGMLDAPSSAGLGTHWTSLGDLAFGTRREFVYTVHDSEMWLVGGIDPMGTELADVWHSTDGATWTAVTGNGGMRGLYSGCLVSFNGELWLLDYDAVWSSPDGVTWAPKGNVPASYSAPGTDGVYTACVVWNNTWWLIGGNTPTVFSTTDGTTWTQTSSNYGAGSGITYGATVFNNQLYVVASSGVYSSSDGATWVPQTLAFHAAAGPIAVADSKLYAFTSLGTALAASSDGVNWSTVDAALPWTSNQIQCSSLGFLAFGTPSALYVVGGQGPCVAQGWRSP